MFKKLVLAVMVVAVAASLSFAEIAVSGRWGQLLGSTDFDFNSVAVPDNKNETDAGVWGIDLYMGQENAFSLGENVILGLKLGYSQLGTNHLSNPLIALYSDIYAGAGNIYIKVKLQEIFAVSGSAGIFAAYNKFEYFDLGTGKNAKDETWQIMPSVSAAAEFRPIDFLAVGFEVGYMFNGKIDYDKYDLKSAEIYRDISGFNYNFFVKIYLPKGE